MRFLIDENVHRGLVSLVARAGHDAKPSPKGISNGRVLALAVSQKRVLVTHDSDFAIIRTQPAHHGIILLRIPPENLDAIWSSLENLLDREPSARLFANRLFQLFIGRYE